MIEARISCDLLVGNGIVLTQDDARRIVVDGALAAKDGEILAVGATPDLDGRFMPARRLSADGALVLPGLVNVHNHTPLMITRGMVEDLGWAPAYTPGIPQGSAFDQESALALSRLGVLELLRAGSTMFVDFYRYPQALAQAAVELGARAVVAGRIADVDMPALAIGRWQYDPAIGQATLDENLELIERWGDHPSGRIRADLGPHAPDTCSPALLREITRESARLGCQVHTHLCQSREEVALVRERDGRTPVETFDAVGLLGPQLIAGHSIFMTESDIARCGEAGIAVAHAPVGNARTGKIAPIQDLAAAGCRIALCTDTFSADMFEAMRTAIASARIRRGGVEPPTPKAQDALDWATRGGAKALGLFDRVGSLETGKRADFVVMDSRHPGLRPVVDGVGLAVHSASGGMVRHVVVDGHLVIEDGQATMADQGGILAEAQAAADRLWRAQQRPTLLDSAV